MRVLYGVLKHYSGIFTKSHDGNSQLFFVELKDEFIALNLLGSFEDGDHACQMIARGPSIFLNDLLGELRKDKNFIMVEELPCKISSSNTNNFSVILPKKGKNITSNFSVKYEPDYSTGNVRVFRLKTKSTFQLEFGDLAFKIANPSQVKMIALKKSAKTKPLFNRLISKLKR